MEQRYQLTDPIRLFIGYRLVEPLQTLAEPNLLSLRPGFRPTLTGGSRGTDSIVVSGGVGRMLTAAGLHSCATMYRGHRSRLLDPSFVKTRFRLLSGKRGRTCPSASA